MLISKNNFDKWPKNGDIIMTSSYTATNDGKKYIKLNRVSISGDRGKKEEFQGKCYPALAPKKDFWKTWHENIGKIDEIENNKYYIEEYYKQVLAKLDPVTVFDELKHKILLCYEDSNTFCHRHIVAAWLELCLGIEVPEINKDVKMVSRPSYIKTYLEKVMKDNIKMGEFNSIYAKYLFDYSIKLSKDVDVIEKYTKNVLSELEDAVVKYSKKSVDEETKYKDQDATYIVKMKVKK